MELEGPQVAGRLLVLNLIPKAREIIIVFLVLLKIVWEKIFQRVKRKVNKKVALIGHFLLF